MTRATVRAIPLSYSQPFLTFRATERTALRTGYGSKSLVGFNKNSVVPAGLVAKLSSERRPTGVRDGFCHLRLPKLGSVRIADDDQFILTGNLGGLLMQMVPPGVGDLGMDGFDTTLIPGPLSGRQSAFVFSVVLERRNGLTVAERRKGLQAQIYTDCPFAGRKMFFNLALERHKPASASVLHKCAGLDLASRLARLPEAECLAIPFYGAAADPQETTLERYPAQRSPTPAAGAKLGRSAGLASRRCELPANLSCRIGAYPEICPATQLRQIKMARPARYATSAPIAFSLALGFTAVIPDEVDCTRMALKPLATRRVFNPKFVSQNHERIIA